MHEEARSIAVCRIVDREQYPARISRRLTGLSSTLPRRAMRKAA